jgi:2-polyprenyl-3-methyl-5-hydroxy-6-metoxy-1,4-benzoquinol methylase
MIITKDPGCGMRGTGRHAIELTKRGYKVTGIDFQNHNFQEQEKKQHQRNLKLTSENMMQETFPLKKSLMPNYVV